MYCYNVLKFECCVNYLFIYLYELMMDLVGVYHNQMRMQCKYEYSQRIEYLVDLLSASHSSMVPLCPPRNGACARMRFATARGRQRSGIEVNPGSGVTEREP